VLVPARRRDSLLVEHVCVAALRDSSGTISQSLDDCGSFHYFLLRGEFVQRPHASKFRGCLRGNIRPAQFHSRRRILGQLGRAVRQDDCSRHAKVKGE